ncbi:MAG: hypothetical protein HY820_06985 [Acidobacteria bacterium]|nr:hypothetical protein [Acidobacteriota bacterium]
MTATSEFLLADARAALRRRLDDPDRTELSRAFAAWLLREPPLKAELASLVTAAAVRKGAQQDFQTVATLGYGAEAGVIEGPQVDALKQGLRRLAGREPFVDGVPMPFCQDAVGILGVALGVKAAADGQITSEVVAWTARFLKASYDMERTEDWHRCLFAAADQQLGSPQNFSVPPSAAVADLRAALVARSVLNDEALAAEDSDQTLRLALTESQADLPIDRAVLRLAATEFVVRNAAPIPGGKSKSAAIAGSLSKRDASVHEVVGKDLFNSHTNAEIMRDVNVKKRLRAECQLASNDAIKRCLDRIRETKGYPLSREVTKKRAIQNQTTGKNGQRRLS